MGISSAYSEEAASSKIIAADTFTLDGKERVAGKPLANLITEEGDARWVANGETVFSPDGKVVTFRENASFVAAVAISQPDRAIVVQARVVPESSEWVAVGFQPEPSGEWFTSELFVILPPNGIVELFGPQATSLFRQQLPKYSSAKPHTIALKYDPVTRMASVFVDGDQVIKPQEVSLSQPIGAAGFSSNVVNVAGDTWVDDFEVKEVAP